MGPFFRPGDWGDLTDWCVDGAIARFRCRFFPHPGVWAPTGLTVSASEPAHRAAQICRTFCNCGGIMGGFHAGGHGAS